MRLSVRYAAILLIGPILEELLTVVGANAKAHSSGWRQEKGVNIESCLCIRAVDCGSECSFKPPENNPCLEE
jgi:hypothetical protein